MLQSIVCRNKCKVNKATLRDNIGSRNKFAYDIIRSGAERRDSPTPVADYVRKISRANKKLFVFMHETKALRKDYGEKGKDSHNTISGSRIMKHIKTLLLFMRLSN